MRGCVHTGLNQSSYLTLSSNFQRAVQKNKKIQMTYNLSVETLITEHQF